jgi:hypothetical protein
VITAAHCCVGFTTDKVYVVAGQDHEIFVKESSEQLRKTTAIIMHPAFDQFTKNNDICLLTLDKKLNFGT